MSRIYRGIFNRFVALFLTVFFVFATLPFNTSIAEDDINKKMMMFQTTLDIDLQLFAEEGTQPAVWQFSGYDEQEHIALYNVSTTNQLSGNKYVFDVYVVFNSDMLIQEVLASCNYNWRTFEYNDVFTMLAIFDSVLTTLARDSYDDNIDDAFNVIFDMTSGEYQQNKFVFIGDYSSCTFAYSLNIENDDSVSCDLYIMYSKL